MKEQIIRTKRLARAKNITRIDDIKNQLPDNFIAIARLIKPDVEREKLYNTLRFNLNHPEYIDLLEKIVLEANIIKEKYQVV